MLKTPWLSIFSCSPDVTFCQWEFRALSNCLWSYDVRFNTGNNTFHDCHLFKSCLTKRCLTNDIFNNVSPKGIYFSWSIFLRLFVQPFLFVIRCISAPLRRGVLLGRSLDQIFQNGVPLLLWDIHKLGIFAPLSDYIRVKKTVRNSISVPSSTSGESKKSLQLCYSLVSRRSSYSGCLRNGRRLGAGGQDH